MKKLLDDLEKEKEPTDLLMASFYGREIVQMLFDKNADVNAKVNDGSTALQIAPDLDRKEIVQILHDKMANS